MITHRESGHYQESGPKINPGYDQQLYDTLRYLPERRIVNQYSNNYHNDDRSFLGLDSHDRQAVTSILRDAMKGMYDNHDEP